MRKAFCTEKRRRIGATAGALHFAALTVKYDAAFKGIECFALPLKGGIFQQEKEKAKSGQNALGTGMEKLQNLTKKQKIIAGAAVILVVLLIFAGTSLSGGKKQNSSTSNLPTEREMVSDVVKNSQWEGTILNLSIIDDDINRQYEVYTADCEIESKRQGGSGTTSKAKITYKLQDDEWVFVKCEKQN